MSPPNSAPLHGRVFCFLEQHYKEQADNDLQQDDMLPNMLRDYDKTQEQYDQVIKQLAADQDAIKKHLPLFIQRREKFCLNIQNELPRYLDPEEAESIIQSVRSQYQVLIGKGLSALGRTHIDYGVNIDYTEDMLELPVDQGINNASQVGKDTGLVTPRTLSPAPARRLAPRLSERNGMPRRGGESDPYDVETIDSDSDSDDGSDIRAEPPRKRKRPSATRRSRTLRTTTTEEVQGQDYVFQHKAFGKDWLVVVCKSALDSRNSYHFANHPFEGGRAKKHFSGGAKANKCHDIAKRYAEDEEIIYDYGYRVEGANAEWAKRNNESLAKAAATATAAAAGDAEAEGSAQPRLAFRDARRHAPANPAPDADMYTPVTSDI